MQREYDLVIVGAGPAGAMLAYYLSSLPVKILVLDKKSMPRYKACGGGLSYRALELLPFQVDGVLEDVDSTTMKVQKGRFVPFGPDRDISVAAADGLIIGDAACLIDPITGEGIYHAVLQAKLAAGVLREYFLSDFRSLQYGHCHSVNSGLSMPYSLAWLVFSMI
jgi:flavin-dependent dehydrogenase